MAARLQHPHILTVLDSGDAAGRLWFTMPYAQGGTLRQRLRQFGALPAPEAISIMQQLAGALAYAHRHGVIHRDVRPANVLLSHENVFLAGFGVARPLDAAADLYVTTAGLVVGTPSYMAPEQAVADAAVDHRADIYAFGVLAYEMLAGEPPFANLPLGFLLAAHATREPEPISSLRSGVPPLLETVIARCLRKRRADRWDSADALCDALRTVTVALQSSSTSGSGTTRIRAPAPATSATGELERPKVVFTRRAWRQASHSPGLVHAAPLVAVAGPHAQRHGGGDTRVASAREPSSLCRGSCTDGGRSPR